VNPDAKESFPRLPERYGVPAGALLLLILVLAVYLPILPGSLLMDDWRLIGADNPLVNGQFTIFNIWFQTDFTLSSAALWIEHALWGQHPAGYHLVNILLHATSAVLLWRILKTLKVPGAWLAGALYAVHPVCVNSVARAAEIKNTLSLPFFLLSILAYLHYEAVALYPRLENPDAGNRPRDTGTSWYVLALMAFVAALLSKTSTVMLPLVLLACAAWQRGRLRAKDGVHVLPFFVLSLGFGLMSVWFQKYQALASITESLQPSSFAERLAVAGQVFWFYLGKALWPVNLCLVYPQWRTGASAWMSYLPHIALIAVLVAGWTFRRTWGRHVLLALVCFGVMLFPVLGLFDSQFLASWQVSDHLQYLPLIAPVALVAALVAWLPIAGFRIAATILVVSLGGLTFQRATVFASLETLMRDTLAKNPAASKAHNDLGTVLAQRNDLSGAAEQFKAAIEAQPDNVSARANLGQAYAIMGQFADAEKEYQTALTYVRMDATTHDNYAELLRHEGRNQEALFHYRVAVLSGPDILSTRLALASLAYQLRDPALTIAQYQAILQRQPGNLEALNNLAWLLATSSDDKVRNGGAAVTLAYRACALTEFKHPRFTGTLAAAYAEAGHFAEAVKMGELTVRLAGQSGDSGLVYSANQVLNRYRQNQPHREQ